MTLSAGTRLGNYEIVASIGSGGMGDVYRARDARLERDVAIKTVRSSGDGDDARARLWREARAAASVNHPGVCQIFDVGEIDRDIFIVMELLDGISLEQRLRQGAMPLDEALQTALGILDSLDALHRRAVVHRDLKPSNVFLNDGRVKLLDFGLARPVRAIDASDLTVTQAGIAVGTPRYMAPEQWAGGPPDPRTDLFAAGLLLFEMLTGKPAFAGDDLMQMYHLLMTAQPPALTGSPTIVAIDAVVHRALEKRPEDRYPSAAAMAQALRAASTGSHGVMRAPVRAATRLIVLPFRMARPDPDLDFLSFSLADAVTASLAGFESLVVRSTLAGAKYAGDTLDLRTIASELAVDAVLGGSLLCSPAQVRLTAQLVEAPSGAVLWSQTFQAARQDIFELQDQLVRRIIESLSGPLSAREAGRLQRGVPASARAYEFYLRANQLSHDPSQLAIAEDLYQSAIREDPTYAPAWARLGRVCRILAKYGGEDAHVHQRRASDAFQEALRLDPDSSVAHNHYTNFEVETLGRAKEAMARLLERSRSHSGEPEIYAGLVLACRYCGLLDASLAADRQARRLDPAVRTSVMFTHFMRGDWQRALETDTEEMQWVRLAVLPLLGRVEEAVEGYRRVEDRPLPPMMRLMVQADRYAVERRRDEVVTRITQFNRFRPFDPEAIFLAARALAHVGDYELAFDVLEESITSGFFCPSILGCDPWLEPLRSDPRFAQLVARAEARSRDAAEEFTRLGGERLLGI